MLRKLPIHFDREKLVLDFQERVHTTLVKTISSGIHADNAEDRLRKLREIYVGMPPEQLAQLLIRTAQRKTQISGGISGTTTTGSDMLFFAPDPTLLTKAFGLGGMAASVSGDLINVSRIQMQLIYDIAMLYGVPYDPDDEEDIWAIFMAAFGSKGLEKASLYTHRVFAEFARRQLGNLMKSGMKQTVQVWARKVLGRTLAKLLAERYVMRLIPVANIAIGAVGNGLVTKQVGKWAVVRARIRSATFKHMDVLLKSGREHVELIPAVIFLAGTADDTLTVNAAGLYRQSLKRLGLTDGEKENVQRLLNEFDVEQAVIEQLEEIKDPDVRKHLFGLALVTNAAATLKAKAEDHTTLTRIAAALRQPYRPPHLQEKIRELKK